MRGDLKKHSVRTRIIAVIICLVLAALAVILLCTKGNDTEKTVTEEVQVEKRDISRTVTAAGEVVTAVETGVSSSSFVEIKSGLSEGDNVLVRESDSSSSGWSSFGPGGSGGFPGDFGGSGGPPGDFSGMPGSGGKSRGN